MAFTWEAKDPDEVYEYEHDWAERLLVNGADVGDAILLAGNPDPTKNPSLVVQSGTVVIDAVVHVPGTSRFKYWLRGGTAVERCVLVGTVFTQQGRTYQESFRLTIRER